MTRRGLGAVLLLAWLGAMALLGSTAEAAPAGSTILQLKLQGVVDPFMASYVTRGIDRANADGDAAVLLTIDTPGGTRPR